MKYFYVASKWRPPLRDGQPLQNHQVLEPPKATFQLPRLNSLQSRLLTDVIEKRWKNPRPIKRWLTKDIYPLLGNRPLKEISPAEIQRLVFQKRDSGRPAAASRIRSILFGLFARITLGCRRSLQPCA
jgi:hypothetical protein